MLLSVVVWSAHGYYFEARTIRGNQLIVEEYVYLLPPMVYR